MDDFYLRRSNGVREPDPTLGKRYRHSGATPRSSDPHSSGPHAGGQPRHERAIVESVPPAPAEEEEKAPKPEHHAKVKREKVILADPRRVHGTLRARVELEEQTSWGKLLVKDLVKIQLKTAVASSSGSMTMRSPCSSTSTPAHPSNRIFIWVPPPGLTERSCAIYTKRSFGKLAGPKWLVAPPLAIASIFILTRSRGDSQWNLRALLNNK